MKIIAIVEDEPALRENYTDVLTKQGFQVEAYSTGQLAMEAFDKRLPDLALLDIGLEGDVDGGFEFYANFGEAF